MSHTASTFTCTRASETAPMVCKPLDFALEAAPCPGPLVTGVSGAYSAAPCPAGFGQFSGTLTFSGGTGTVTIGGVVIDASTSDGTHFAFTASSAHVTAAYVVHFNGAVMNGYTYASGVAGDCGLEAPGSDNPACPAKIDSIIFCVDISNLFTVSKTAVPSYKQKCVRDLSLVANPTSVTLSCEGAGSTAGVCFTVASNATPSNYDIQLNGVITVTNSSAVSVLLSSLIDGDTAGGTAVISPNPSNVTIAAGASVSYNYTTTYAVLPTGSYFNKAVAQLSLNSISAPKSGSAPFSFDGLAPSQQDGWAAAVDLTLSTGQTAHYDIPACTNFSQQLCIVVGPYAPGSTTSIGATATLVSSLSYQTLKASTSVLVTVDPCPIYCTNTIGWWPNKNGIKDPTWGTSQDAPFYDTQYTWLSIMTTAANGDAVVILGQQFAAATLNQLRGLGATLTQFLAGSVTLADPQLLTAAPAVYNAYNASLALFKKGTANWTQTDKSNAKGVYAPILTSFNNGNYPRFPHCN